MPATVRVTGAVDSLSAGMKVFFATITSTASVSDINQVTLAATTDYTVTKPTGAIGVLIYPPTPNTQTLILKGVGGDTGLVLHPTNPTILTLATATTTFILRSSGIVTGIELYWF